VARHCVARRALEWEPEVEAGESAEDAELPEGWVLHPPHGAL
jgi:hypothetical protein